VLRDLIALYRGYYWEIKAILIISTLVGSAVIASAIYLYTSSLISVGRLCFDLSIGVFTATFSITAHLLIERKWGGKLRKVKAEEKALKESLGGVIEAEKNSI